MNTTLTKTTASASRMRGPERPKPSKDGRLALRRRLEAAGGFIWLTAGWLVVICCAAWPMRAASAAASPITPPYLAGVVADLTACWPTNHTVNIVCHGHSVPAGYFKTPEVRALDAYPALLRHDLCKRFPHAVLNVIVTGIGGENSEQGAARFQQDVLSLRPEVVTIDYGLNDRAIGVVRAEAAWRRMIQAALAAGVKVILLTPTIDLTARLADPNDPLNQAAADIRRLAGEYQVGLVDSLAAFQAYAKHGGRLARLMAQANHPNQKGHRLVAEKLLEWFPSP